MLDIASLGIAGEAIVQPPVVPRSWTDRRAPPLVRNGVGQQAVVNFVGDGTAGNGGNLRRPSGGHGVIGKLDDFERGGRRCAVERHVIGELFDGSCGVSRAQVLMGRFEENVKIESSFIAFELLECASDNSAREARFVPRERVSLGGASSRPFRQPTAAGRLFAACNHHHVRRHGDVHSGGEAVDTVCVHRKPAPRVKQVRSVVADVSQLQSLHWTLVRGIKCALVFKSERRRTVLGQRRCQLHAHGRVLGNAFGTQRLARHIEHLGHTQGIVQFERGDVSVLNGSELHLRASDDLVDMRAEFRVDLVVVHSQAHFLGGPRR